MPTSTAKEEKGNSHDLFMQNRYLLYDFECASVPAFFRWLVLRRLQSLDFRQQYVRLFIYFIGSMGEILRAFAHRERKRAFGAMKRRWEKVERSVRHTHNIHSM